MDLYAEHDGWIWGLSLITVTIAIHAAGLVLTAVGMGSIFDYRRKRHHSVWAMIPTVICVISVVGLLLVCIHGVEALVWAGAYLWHGTFDSLSDAMLFSLDTMTTRGASGLTLHSSLSIMGALEATDGMLLFGISTAFLFALLQSDWPLLHPSGD